MKYLNYCLFACLALVSASSFGMMNHLEVVKDAIKRKDYFVTQQENQQNAYFGYVDNNKNFVPVEKVPLQPGKSIGVNVSHFYILGRQIGYKEANKTRYDEGYDHGRFDGTKIVDDLKNTIAQLEQSYYSLFGAFTAGCAFTAFGFYAWQKWFRK